ncbi:MAG TPA: vanadium-dependent haloperoxidase [Bryobacteraceae bacterium]|nr:vanadium-dependent haloperoxidase [Bryobacteraceae bacterium]
MPKTNRTFRSFAVRQQAAAQDAFFPAPPQIDNGEEALYSDKCGTYTKGVQQTGIGLVDLAAYEKFKKALNSGKPADFDAIPLGGPRTLNGPQGGLAFDLECLDNSQFTVPPAPAVASEQYATELVELYWAALLRDVAFTDYLTNAVAAQAAAELTSLPTYAGPRDGSNKVTPALLFRGGLAGETIGPYLSQFLLQNTSFGALPIVQQYNTFMAAVDFMKDPVTFQQVQNGISTGLSLTSKPPVFLHDGRGLGAYTHSDVLYEAYFIAYLLLNTLNAPLNPGNPYNGDKTQNGFGTFGQPDIAATLAAVAREALKVVWYQKWFVHLRHRPESGGALVYLAKTGQGGTVECQLSPTVLNSNAVKTSFTTNSSYFLPQAFPEGSPTHPAYPTGHGTVAGACITVLKFFFDGTFVLPNPQVPSNNGTALNKYTGSDAGQINVNGELHKLAHNISFAHGIHAGIHWRSDTDTSIALGEQVALSILEDRANTYNEKFTVQLTKLDGTTATISNQ